MKIGGSTFLVTGGASGLGAATVRHLHALAARVLIADVAEQQAKRRAGAGRARG